MNQNEHKDSISKLLTSYIIGNESLSSMLDTVLVDKEEIFLSFNISTENNIIPLKQLYPTIKNHIIKDLQLTKDSNKIFITCSINKKKSNVDLISYPNIKNIIAINSSKGGVGKSSTAIHIAYALQSLNLKVGLLDADIQGPSISQMTNLAESPKVAPNSKIIPLQKDNIKFNSISFFLKQDSVLSLQSPLIAKTFVQLLNDTDWGNLDFLIIDLPPGTGDIHLKLYKNYQVTTTILVSTPQEVALIDLNRTITMLNNFKQKIFGLIENMSYFICDNCNKKHHIFSKIKTKSVISKHNINTLIKVPLYEKIQNYLDTGTNIIKENPTHPISNSFISLATTLNTTFNL